MEPQMMHNLLAKWRSVPYMLSIFIWIFAIFLIGDRIGAPYFQSDSRLRFTYTIIGTLAVSFLHDLIYRRKSLSDLLVSLAILAPFFILGVWLSFALYDADTALNYLPLLAAVIVAWGVDVLVRKKHRKE